MLLDYNNISQSVLGIQPQTPDKGFTSQDMEGASGWFDDLLSGTGGSHELYKGLEKC